MLNDRNIRVDYSLTERAHQSTPGEYMGYRRDRERRGGDFGGGGGGGGRGRYERDRDHRRDDRRDPYGRDDRDRDRTWRDDRDRDRRSSRRSPEYSSGGRRYSRSPSPRRRRSPSPRRDEKW